MSEIDDLINKLGDTVEQKTKIYKLEKELQEVKTQCEQLQKKYKLNLDAAHCNYSQKQDEYLNLLAAMKEIKDIAKKYQAYNRSGFEEILQIIEQ